MKHTAKRWLVSGVAMLLVLSMVLGLSMAAFAAETSKKFDLTDSDKDGKFNYVSIGASNTNGYGMRGYITDEEIDGIISGKLTKDQVNVYGYQRSPENSYTDLISDYIEAQNPGVTVNHDQLAISSMRVEEVRVLLDNDYYGDAYTRWRFIGGWFEIAEPGGMEVLRQKYQSAVKEADLITLDIGWNNFGVYVCNRLTSYLESGKASYTADLTEILGEGSEAVAEDIVSSIMAEVKPLLSSVGGSFSDEDIRFVSETFAYALVGYIYHMDIVLGKIYELNPDAQVVVLGVQNLLHDANVKNGDSTLPLGMVYGEIVNMANVYSETMSPYKDKYIYTMTGDAEGHVNTFLDEIQLYDNDPVNLNPNIKDCFDIYDDDLMIKYKLQYMIDEMYKNELKIIGMTAAEFVAAGEAGRLDDEISNPLYRRVAKEKYEQYVAALNEAYDTAADIMSYIANLDALDLAGVAGDLNAAEDLLSDYLWNSIEAGAMAGMNGESYEPDYSIFEDSTNSFQGIINVRFYIGNSFFAHPSDAGHKEIYDDVINAANGGKVTTVTTMFKEQLQSVVAKIACEKTGHYGSLTWTWAEDCSTATATQSCYRCNKTETATANKTITKTTVEPTCAAAGKTVYTAKVTLLGKEQTSTKEVAGEPAKPHTMEAVAEVPATSEQDGTKAHYKCTVCGKLFLDKEGKQEVKAEDLVIKISHNLTEVKEVPATCETAGIKGYYKCSDCGKLFLDKECKQEVKAEDLTIAATGHKPVEVKEVPAACETAGTKAHYKCACGNLYADAEGKTAVKAEDLVIAATGHKKLTEVKEVPATCERDGAKGYYKCSDCNKMYADKDAKTEVKDADLVIKGGHQYKDGICTVCGHDINEYNVFRVFGENRYETAFAVADELKETLKVEKFQNVVVASGSSFADALAGSYLAAQKDAPILLVNNYTMVSVKDYIRANVAEGGTVYLLGGEAAISKAMEDGLKGYTVKRLAGADRYETNMAILLEAGIPEDGEILVCTGKKFADSLSASAVGKPILLVKNSLYDTQKQYLKYLDAKLEFVIIGGESAISADLAKELEAYGTTERVGGENRYETSTLLAERFFEKPVPTSAVLAYAKKFPDGLCGGPLAYSLGAPMILTQTGQEAAAVEYTTANKIGSGYVLGGTGLISDESAKEIFGADKIGVK